MRELRLGSDQWLTEELSHLDAGNGMRVGCRSGWHCRSMNSLVYRRALESEKDVVDLDLLAEVYADFNKDDVAEAPMFGWRDAPKRLVGGMTAARNPFLAGPDDLDGLWETMAAGRLTMG